MTSYNDFARRPGPGAGDGPECEYCAGSGDCPDCHGTSATSTSTGIDRDDNDQRVSA
jgi:hypothetical protein